MCSPGFFCWASVLWLPKKPTPNYASSALHYARHRTEYELIRDVIRRDILPLLSDPDPINNWAAFHVAQSLGGLLAEHGQFNRAQVAYDLLSRLGVDSLVRDALPAQHAALLRRHAMTRLVKNPADRHADAMLLEAAEADPANENMNVSVANTRGWMLLDNGRHTEARDLLQPLFDIYSRRAFTPAGTPEPVAVTIWNLAELFRSFGNAVQKDRSRKASAKSEHAFELSRKLFRHGGAKIYAAPGFGQYSTGLAV